MPFLSPLGSICTPSSSSSLSLCLAGRGLGLFYPCGFLARGPLFRTVFTPALLCRDLSGNSALFFSETCALSSLKDSFFSRENIILSSFGPSPWRRLFTPALYPERILTPLAPFSLFPISGAFSFGTHSAFKRSILDLFFFFFSGFLYYLKFSLLFFATALSSCVGLFLTTRDPFSVCPPFCPTGRGVGFFSSGLGRIFGRVFGRLDFSFSLFFLFWRVDGPAF